MSSTYKKITDLFSKRERSENHQPIHPIYEMKTVHIQTLPDIGGPPYHNESLEKTNSNSKQVNELYFNNQTNKQTNTLINYLLVANAQ